MIKKVDAIILKVTKNIKNQGSITALSPELGFFKLNINGFNSIKYNYAAIFKITNYCTLIVEDGVRKYGQESYFYKFHNCLKIHNFHEIITNYSHFLFLMNIYKVLLNLPASIFIENDTYYIFHLLLKLQNTIVSFKKDEIWLVEYYFYYYLCFAIGYSIPKLEIKNECCINNKNLLFIDYRDMTFACNQCQLRKKGLSNYKKIAKCDVDLLNSFKNLKFINLVDSNLTKKNIQANHLGLKFFFANYFMFNLNRKVI